MIDEQRDGAATDDPWLLLLLGSVALAERVEASLGSDESCQDGHDARPEATAAELDLLLGVVSLRCTLLAAARALADAAPDRIENGTTPRTPRTGLLR